MKKILSVIKREYLQIVRTKGFIIGTVLGPVLMLSFIIIPVLVSVVSVDKQEVIGVIDESRQFFSELEQKLDTKLKDGQKRFLLKNYPITEDIEILQQQLNQSVLEKELTAYIIIPDGIIEGEPAEYFSEHVSDFDKIETIRDSINSVVVKTRLETEGLDPDKIAEYMKRTSLRTSKVSKRGVEEDTGGTFIIAYFLIIILYMTLIFYGTIIMRGVIEEKTSRVVEVVLSSLKPFQLMMGKILGIAAVGLTQYIIWALFGLAATHYSGALVSGLFPAAEGFKVPTIPVYVFIYFIIFFILGYFLYATLYAAVGSTVNSEKEAQQLTLPVTMSLVVPFLLVMFVIRAPNSSLSVVLSLIPFFSPILMMVRVGTLLPPFPQILASIVILIITILIMVWLAAKIYRVGILMYGKRPAVREIIKWLRYK